jgi:protoporphyrinogen oxidase
VTVNGDPVCGSTRPVVDVRVVGAGISGLVTAFGLQRAAWVVQGIDAGVRPGGVIGSVLRDGFLFERGPNRALDTSERVAELLAQLGLAGLMRLASAAAAKRCVVRGGGLIALPTTPGAFLTTGLFSLAAKLALLREPFVPAAPPAKEQRPEFLLRRWHAGFGCLLPRQERRRILGVLFSSSMSAGRAPTGQVLLTSFAGGQRDPAVPAGLGALPSAQSSATTWSPASGWQPSASGCQPRRITTCRSSWHSSMRCVPGRR